MILLDTHVWLWWLHTPEQLSNRSRTLLTIGENQNTLMVSAISVWEIAVKHSVGKLPLPLAVNEWFALAKTLNCSRLEARCNPCLISRAS